MKKVAAILSAALLLCGAASCVREAEYVPVWELGSPQAAGLVGVTADGGSVRCDVFANGEYTVALESQWLFFEDLSRDVRTRSLRGDGSFSITMDENDGETRYGTVLLSRGTRTVTITVRQRGRMSSDAGIIATLVSYTPSSLTFSWTRDVDGEAAPEPDYAYSYRFSLFRDAAGSDLVVSHVSEASAACWGKAQPMFAFGGLREGNTYYFLCEQLEEDSEGTVTAVQHSDMVMAETPAFTPVTVPSTPARVGDVILAEDWSVCPWLSDMVSKSAGFIPAEDARVSLDGPSGISPEGALHVWSSENEIMTNTTYRHLIEASRIGGWSKRYDHDITGRTALYMHAGHVKIGGSSYSAQLVSPMLSCIPDGYEATLEVTVRLARYDNDSDMTFVSTAQGTTGYNATYGNWFKPSSFDSQGAHFSVSNGWNYYTLTLQHVRASSYLVLGPDFELANTGNGSSQHRLMIGDIIVKVKNLAQVQTLSVSAVRFSDATLSWTRLDDASVTAYELLLNGVKYASYAPDSNGALLTGLSMDTGYEAYLKAVRSSGEVSESSHVSFNTAGLRIYKVFSDRICLEWDDLVPATEYTSGNYNRGYQIEVYRDKALTDLFYSACSYNGSGVSKSAEHEWAFIGKPSSAICGKSGGAAKAFPTRASAGSLNPASTYWFRIRSLDGVKVPNYYNGSEVTIANPAGTSEWSEAVEASTLSAHTSSSKEVIFNGFDNFGVGADWTCYAAGIGPKMQTPAGYATLDIASYSGEWCMFNMYSYTSMRLDKWGLSSPCPGSGNTYLDSRTLNYGKWSRTNYVDEAGWHYDGKLGALMGQLHLCDMDAPSTGGCFFGTPVLAGPLTDEPRTCVVSLGAFATGANYTDTANKELMLRVFHPDTGIMDEGIKLTVPVRYIPARGATKNDYSFDVSFWPLSAEVSLKKGDVVIIANEQTANRIIVDDFLIELK